MSYPELKKTLAQHLANENYELAAVVRDELNSDRFIIFRNS
jgi:protein-arginine kinase activator protein McsA